MLFGSAGSFVATPGPWANEVAVAAFLDRRIGFLEIAAIVADVLDRFDPPKPPTIDAVLAIDTEARALAGERVKDSVA